MTTDTFHALCAELLDHAERAQSVAAQGPWYGDEDNGLFARARAALADEPAVPDGRDPAAVIRQPSDAELTDLWSWAAGQDQGFWPTQQHCFARAVLARWGNHVPAPPAEGEVAELVAELHNFVAAYKCGHNHDHIWSLSGSGINARLTVTLITRAAELLQRQALVPVSVSERLPGPEDCDAEGRCWLSTTETDPGWVLDFPERCTNWTHWLPAHALPLPEASE